MRSPINATLKQLIYDAVASTVKEKNLPEHEPLEYYAEEIFLRTLKNCVIYFSKMARLRKSEKVVITTLKNDIEAEMKLSLIERRLLYNLSKIKPIWGELFGTNRGHLYNTMIALKEWACFHTQTRLFYKQLYCHATIIAEQSEQLRQASQLVLHHETVNRSLTQHAASQFITLQQLHFKQSTHSDDDEPFRFT